MFEVTHRQFDAESDATDHLVWWVLADSIERVRRHVGLLGTTITPLDLTPDQCLPDVDFVLPREWQALRDICCTEHEL